MTSYTAPVDDYVFLFHDVLKLHEHRDLPGFADFDPEFTRSLLQGLADFHEKVLHPVNRAADEEGARLVDGRVRTPGPFKELARQYRESGWLAAGVPERLGGAGLPPVFGAVSSEFSVATGQSFRMYFSFCAPAAEMLDALAEPWIKEHVVPRLVAGEWTATMAMTEAHCGTDLRQIRTRAEPLEDGTWRLRGSKIFISGGDNDLGENVVHIVLAKVPGPDGRISNDLSSVNVFLVSRRRIDPATGALGVENGVGVGSIEHKMGLAGSATCVMNFEDAIGHRIAAPGRTGAAANMAAMFFLMNYARVGVAMSGIGYTEIAQQNAAAYARERLSGRATRGPVNPSGPADPIIVHADIRRLLLGARAFAEGARALGVKIAFMQSLARHGADEAEKTRCEDLMAVMTPVMKAYCTDKGFECANDCLQVLGGHGFIAEYGLEHFVRNARVGQLYEGANGIQALDLVKRKLTAHQGRPRASFFGTIERFVAAQAGTPGAAPYVRPLAAALDVLGDVLDRASAADASDPDASAAAAYDILTMFGIVAVGWAWAEIACLILEGETVHLGEEAKARKLALARVWMAREMPLVRALGDRALLGSEPLMGVPSDLI